MPRPIFLLLAILLTAPAPLQAHSGKTDSYGCHHHAKLADYHCHSGPLAGKTFPSKDDMLRGLESAPKGAALPPQKPATAAEFQGKVVGVMDGDTLEVLRDGRAARIRLFGIDCPEKRQPFGAAAKTFASVAAFGKVVKATVKDTDQYGRLVAEVELPDGKILNQELVRAGLAWWYKRYAPDEAELGELEQEAKLARAGLWKDSQPTAPWAFRRTEKIAGR